jgi:hypothetical protein
MTHIHTSTGPSHSQQKTADLLAMAAEELKRAKGDVLAAVPALTQRVLGDDRLFKQVRRFGTAGCPPGTALTGNNRTKGYSK